MQTATNQKTFSALLASSSKETGLQLQIQQRRAGKLESGEVSIRVAYSSLNYKDALCASGHPGVARKSPIVPGIDAAGTVVESRDPKFKPGDDVMVFHAKFGTESDGGYAELIQVPGEWVYPLPNGLSAWEAMALGTAGFTAAMSVDALLKHGLSPSDDAIVVTGATGGVGIFAVKLLAKLGFKVIAATGKSDKAKWLQQHGAHQIISRNDVIDESNRPLLTARWGGAVDTVGGLTLATIVRSVRPHGCVTACGVVAGHELPLTVYPFILRGVTLVGIDSANIKRDERESIWGKISTTWRIHDLESLTTEVALADVQSSIESILAGGIFGRVVVKLT